MNTIVLVMFGWFASAFLQWLYHRRQSEMFVGWGRVSLLGRVEHVGAIREVTRAGQTWVEVLTFDGQSIRTQPGAVYTIQRLPFSTIEEKCAQHAERLEEARRDDLARLDRVIDARDAFDSRVEDLRKAIAHARDDLSDGPVHDALNKALGDDEEAARQEEIPF